MKTCSILGLLGFTQATFLLDPKLDSLKWDKVKLKSYTNCNLGLLEGFSAFFKEEAIQYPELQVHVHDEAPTIFLMQGEKVVDEFFVGHYDSTAMHALLHDLGLKRNKERTHESVEAEIKLA